MAAATFAAPELDISEKEAKQVANAIARVGEHYAVNVDPKTLAWLNLGWAFSCVYGSRGVALIMRKRHEKTADAIAKETAEAPEAAPENDIVPGIATPDAIPTS